MTRCEFVDLLFPLFTIFNPSKYLLTGIWNGGHIWHFDFRSGQAGCAFTSLPVEHEVVHRSVLFSCVLNPQHLYSGGIFAPKITKYKLKRHHIVNRHKQFLVLTAVGGCLTVHLPQVDLLGDIHVQTRRKAQNTDLKNTNCSSWETTYSQTSF